MQDKIITLTATFTAKKGMEESLKNVLLKLIKPTRAEEGCIYYYLHQKSDDAATFMFYEQWKSLDALNKHSSTEHLKNAMTAAKEFAEKQPELTYLNLI
jgi:quinol monooxygenase YgiN